ncbi:hypothetical protein DSO57_1023270 [Entomophthora muscae]|nr:hypothetical protein DSO57_1023270 [Entomophthora muscae]
MDIKPQPLRSHKQPAPHGRHRTPNSPFNPTIKLVKTDYRGRHSILTPITVKFVPAGWSPTP